MSEVQLNKGQEEAYSKLIDFMFNTEKYFILSGMPGTGKSTLINLIENKLLQMYQDTCKCVDMVPEYHGVSVTATTNSAADNLSSTSRTIFSYLNLIVRNRKLEQRSKPYSKGEIIIIDEYTMLDDEAWQYVEKLDGCKIILVGDKDQLLAVSGMSPAIRRLPINYELTEIMRTESTDILKVVHAFKALVNNEEPEELDLNNLTDVDCISPEEFDELICDPDFSFVNSRIITHTNQKSIECNQFIRAARGLPEHFTVGETVSNNSYRAIGNRSFKTDGEFKILEVNPVITSDLSEDGATPLNTYTVRHAGGTDTVIHGPDKYKHFDLRSRYSSTVYKAQGRSFETIYIDLTGFPDNLTREVLVRSLYVGASRARKKVVFIGELSERLQDKL